MARSPLSTYQLALTAALTLASLAALVVFAYGAATLAKGGCGV